MASLDVRPMMAAGQEPFAAIMEVVGRLGPDEDFELVAPLEPVPLYQVLGARGFGHETEALGGGDYRVLFRREAYMTTKTASIVGRAGELAQFSGNGFGRRTLAETDRFRAVVVGLEDGQQIPLHTPRLDLVMTIVEGIGQVMVGDQPHSVRAGDVIVVPAGERRGLRAIGGRLVAVNVVSPPPGDGDHAESRTSWPVDAAAPDVAGLILKEHAGLFPHLDDLAGLAGMSAEMSEAELRSRLADVLQFLREGLLPHAREEEVSVYPAAERVIRAVGGATRTMSIDHRSVGEMVDELERVSQGPLAGPDRERLRRLLYGLEVLLRVHFTKENEAYVPLLSRLSTAERQVLYQRLAGGSHPQEHNHLPKES